jgi:L,D-transpeptidase ErfK/SrfK
MCSKNDKGRAAMIALIPAILLLAQLVGSEFYYTVDGNDTLASLSSRFGVDVKVLAESNGLKTKDRLQPGQTLKIDNRHITPPHDQVEIIVNIPQRMLFRFSDQGQVSSAYPIAAGKHGWKTPVAEFEILGKEEKPAWDVPVSIQEEMRRSGKPVVTRVPPSPHNPLGDYWIGLSLPGIGIHGTNAPTSIYKLVTHGCIRMRPSDIREFFPNVDIGMRGRIIYQPVLVLVEENAVFLEAHPDVYKKESDTFRTVLDIARSAGFFDVLDLPLVKEVIQQRHGIARDVTRR